MDKMNFLLPLDHSLNFYFKESKDNFSVVEEPLYPFSNSGEHLILKVRKKDLSTWDLVDILSSHIGVKSKDIGYAGLKDKNAITTQYISLPKKFESKISNFSHPKIKILEATYHKNKIRIGHLKGNFFWVRLKRVQESEYKIILSILEWIKKEGMPNYFGAQRFGLDKNNHIIGKEIVKKIKKEKNKKLRKFFISAYQSFLFNLLLSKRVEISKLFDHLGVDELKTLFNSLTKDEIKDIKKQNSFLKLFDYELMHHYPFGKVYEASKEESYLRFIKRDSSPTGLVAGKRVKRARGFVGKIEKEFDSNLIEENGSRRFLWIFPEIIAYKYIKEKRWFELNFYLPKGSYATVLVELLRGNRGLLSIN